VKPKLKPPGPKRLKLKCDVLLSNFAFKFNLRRYDVVPRNRGRNQGEAQDHGAGAVQIRSAGGVTVTHSLLEYDKVRQTT
jgi:hypothetical protein